MNMWDFNRFITLDFKSKVLLLDKVNKVLKSLNAEDRVSWALRYLPYQVVLSSGFGIHSIVTLYLITRQYSDIPIILIDTGYLFPETYCYIDQLTSDMKLNLHVFTSLQSAAWQEARYGKLWEQGIEGINQYNYINKIEPMNRAFEKIKVKTWFSGLRHTQSSTREKLKILSVQGKVFKFLPILDWDDDKIFEYIKVNSLVCHPLSNKGYISLGDIHTTHRCQDGINKEKTRFFGLKRECGLHEHIF